MATGRNIVNGSYHNNTMATMGLYDDEIADVTELYLTPGAIKVIKNGVLERSFCNKQRINLNPISRSIAFLTEPYFFQ